MARLFGISNYGNLFGSTSGLYSSLSQYSSIKSGAYAKLTKAYYAKTPTTTEKDTSKTPVKKNQTTKWNESNKALSNAKAEATELVDSAKKLTTTGKDSMFASESKYDKDAVYKAISSFVEDYNDTVSALSKTSNSSVKNAGSSMTRMTDVMSKGLSKIGITVGTDGKLSMDEDTFKKADMDSVKSMFNGSSSYAGIVSSSASRVASRASNQISQMNGGTYGSNAYFNSYDSGSLFNSYF